MGKHVGSKVKRKRKHKKAISPYNIAIVACIIIIIVAICTLISPKDNKKSEKEVATPNNQTQIRETEENQERTPIEVVETETKEGETISEKDALKLAVNQFKKLDEKGINEKKLQIVKILRANEEYYYISSPKNTLEIKLTGGKITRINSVLVENLQKK